MNYQLQPPDPATPHRTVIARTTSLQYGASWTLRAIAILCWLCAAFLLVTGGLWPPPTNACWLAGCGFLAWAFHLLMGQLWRMPSHFVFDNKLGALILQGKDSQQQPLEACLPYEDIRGFRVRRVDAKLDGQQHRHYEVEMGKNDGAFWTIHQGQTREDAEAFCDTIERSTTLYNAPTNPEEAATSAGQIQISEHENYTRLTWRERTPLRHGACWSLLNVGLLCLSLPLQHHLPPLLWQLGLGCLGLFALFGISYALLSLERRHTISIGDEEVRYTLPQTSSEYDNFRMAAKDIHTILFNFSLDPASSRIYVLRPGETNNLLQHKRGQAGFGRADTLEKLQRHIKKIDAKELSFAEQLHLEYALQHIIQRRCGHKVE